MSSRTCFAVYSFASTILASSSIAQTTYYVDDDAPPGQSGLFAWNNAFDNLQDAIDAAVGLGGAPADILIAEGTYFPDQAPPGVDPRDRAFVIPALAPTLRIQGGFMGLPAGINASTAFDQPDGSAVRTVLSAVGAYNNPPAGSVPPAFHVLILEGAGNASDYLLLDGLTITGGRANDATIEINSQGAGIRHLRRGLVELEDLVIYDNWAYPSAVANSGYGGGLFVSPASNSGEHTRVRRTMFRGNHAARGGGIYYRTGGQLRLGNCWIWGNGNLYPSYPAEDDPAPVALYGGGIYSEAQTHLEASNCSIQVNAAQIAGGGVCWEEFQTLNPGTFFHVLRHCTVTNNGVLPEPNLATSTFGAGIHTLPAATNGTTSVKYLVIYNSIVWGNRVGRDLTVEGDWPTNQTVNGLLVHVEASDVGTAFHRNLDPALGQPVFTPGPSPTPLTCRGPGLASSSSTRSARTRGSSISRKAISG